MLNVLKVRIYPNKQQEIALNRNLGCARFVILLNFLLNINIQPFRFNQQLIRQLREG